MSTYLLSNKISNSTSSKHDNNSLFLPSYFYKYIYIYIYILPALEIEETLKSYRQIFSSHYLLGNNKYVDLGECYKEILELIRLSLDQQLVKNFMIYGQSGFGRKSGVRYCVDLLNEKYSDEINLIEINAEIFNSEQEFLQELLQQMNEKNNSSLDSKSFEFKELDALLKVFFLRSICRVCTPICISRSVQSDQFTSNRFSYVCFLITESFTPFMPNLSILTKNSRYLYIVMIDQIELLANTKRQVILYSILDWIKQTRSRILLIGVTSDLRFVERLEKRVKSRLSQEYHIFLSRFSSA